MVILNAVIACNPDTITLPDVSHDHYTNATVKQIDVDLVPYFKNDSVSVFSFSYPHHFSNGGTCLRYKRGFLYKFRDHIRIKMGEFAHASVGDTTDMFQLGYHDFLIESSDTVEDTRRELRYTGFSSSEKFEFDYDYYYNENVLFSDSLVTLDQRFVKLVQMSHVSREANYSIVGLRIDFKKLLFSLHQQESEGWCTAAYWRVR